MNWREDIDLDTRKFLTSFISVMCGLVTGFMMTCDYVSLNHTNALGRHFIAWSESLVALTQHFLTGYADDVFMTICKIGVELFMIWVIFNWWRVPNMIVKAFSCLVCRLPDTNRPLGHRGLNLIELGIMMLIYVVLFASYVTKDAGVFPGTWLMELSEPITKELNPMWELFSDWTIYPRQLLWYLSIFTLWTMWWTPLLLMGSSFTTGVIELMSLRRNNEHFQSGDDCIGECAATHG